MPDAAADLNYLKAGLDQIEAYLASKDLYWPIGISFNIGGTHYPQLTLDGLLLADARLRARTLSSAQAQVLGAYERKLDEVQTSKPVAWEKKALQLYPARLNLWQNYVNDYREDPEGYFDAYGYEVTRRVGLELLDPYSQGRNPAEVSLLETLDLVLKASLEPGEFIWEAELADGFPAGRFWYLYGRLKRKAI